jgi:hypothetical protein
VGREGPALLAAIFAPGASVRQPPVGRTFFAEEVEEYFTKVFEAMPGMRLDPIGWSARDDVVMIEWTITWPAGDSEVTWSGIDRFKVDPDTGLVLDEAVYFDMHPLWAAIDPTMCRPDMIQLGVGGN